ncbi:serine hydrolase domain-containing protein [Sinomicrobium sp.]
MKLFKPLSFAIVLCLCFSVYAQREEAITDLKELEGYYKVTDEVDILIESERFSMGNTISLIEEAGKGQWKVSGLNINFSAKKKNGENILVVERYGESAEIGEELPEYLNNFKDIPLETLADLVAPRYMIANNVPGVSIALIKDHKVTSDLQYGLKNITDPTSKVDVSTVFEACSMSKPLFAYFALKLVEEGKLDLDTPLVEYLGKDYTEDPRHRKITARMVLTHTSGFPNWRPGGRKKGGPIPVLFEPGTKHKYSGEGILFLQRTVEKILGISSSSEMDSLMYESLLKPLGMTHSHYIWQDEYNETYADGHGNTGDLRRKKRRVYKEFNAAFTLYATPVEYAHFLLELMKTDRSAPYSLEETLWKTMTTPQYDTNSTAILPRRDRTATGTRHFGLALRIDRLDSGGLRVGHTGSNGNGFRCISEYNPETGNGLVIMTNSTKGVPVYRALLSYLED